MKTYLIEAKDLETLIAKRGVDAVLDTLIALIRARFSDLDLGAVQVPPRDGLAYRNPALGLIEWMPCRIPGEGAAIKMVAYHPTNPAQRSLPTILSSILVFDTDSGHLAGLLDGTLLTALRTGAMSAVASERLAHPDSRTLGIIGCGAQAVTQAHALSRSFPLETIIGYDSDPTTAESFAARVAFLGLKVETVTRAELPRLVENADILCTCTSADPGAGPVFTDGPTRPHLHINAIGSDFPEKFEVPESLLRRSTVVPDFPDQAIKEGECQQLKAEEIGPDLTTVLQAGDRFEALRHELTIFDSTGFALIDQIVAMEILKIARSEGLGSEIQLECVPEDSKNPYAFLPKSAKAAGSTSFSLEAR